ncbi:MAG TPA: hypothetical protein VFS90_12755 [Pyrinomonadaceae bacterium]|nr:hypothetical protein [Pyrinomonadaceae bacterium]
MTTPSDITPEEINEAQWTWCTRLVAISKAYMERETRGDEYRTLARKFVNELYDNWEERQVFFRPTLAMAPQNFRTTREGALAYFIGEDRNFPNDKGFIKLNWIDARYDNIIEGKEAIQTHGTIGIVMGNVYLTPEVSTDGKDTVVDKVFVYRKYGKGDLRLILHNSAATNLPPVEIPEDY